MTLEEAVEIVLGGEMLLDCSQCRGGGMVPARAGDDIPQHSQTTAILTGGSGQRTVMNFQPCPDCDGQGGTIRLEYAQACQMLGKPLPALRPKGFTYHIASFTI